MKRTRTLKALTQGNKGEKGTCLAVTDIEISLKCRHQGGITLGRKLRKNIPVR
jgi:hypothetical protein